MVGGPALCPGYKEVESFGPDSEYEGEDEEYYVTLDLGPIEPTLLPSSSTYSLIGLDTPTPFLQLSGSVFKGYHNELLGTEILFTDGKDTHDWSKKAVNHVATAEQRITFKEVRIVPIATSSNATAPTPRQSRMGDPDEVDSIEEAPTGPNVDRLTGKSAPKPRVTRARSTVASGKKSQARGTKGKEKEVSIDEN